MKRALDLRIANDLAQKMVLLTGPRQVGKTTLAQQLMQAHTGAQYFNWDIGADRPILQKQTWNPHAPLLIFDEIHKMPGWKNWLKGVADQARKEGKVRQKILVTGNARMDTLCQTGDSLAGRYFSWRLHPICVAEASQHTELSSSAALDRLLERGGFPEPFLAPDNDAAERWRKQYFTDLIREDVLEFSRVHEINAMRIFVELLRERVGAPLSLASIARDLAVSPTTLKKYLDILQALYIVFVVSPWHQNIARALLQAPKVYFFDTGVVRGDDGVRFENAVACMLLKHTHFMQDAHGKDVCLHYIRTKDGAEIDFVLSKEGQLTHLLECKWSDNQPHGTLKRFAAQFPHAQAVQLVKQLRQEEWYSFADHPLHVAQADVWLAQLAI